MKKSIQQVEAIVRQVAYKDQWFKLMAKGDGYLLQLHYHENDIDTGKPTVQHARKWYISPYATESEIVRTAFLACMQSAEHQVREHFYYKKKRIFGPHIEVGKLLELDIWKDHRE